MFLLFFIYYFFFFEPMILYYCIIVDDKMKLFQVLHIVKQILHCVCDWFTNITIYILFVCYFAILYYLGSQGIWLVVDESFLEWSQYLFSISFIFPGDYDSVTYFFLLFQNFIPLLNKNQNQFLQPTQT